MIRGLLPGKLVNVDDSVSNIFVSFLGLLNSFSSINEENKHPIGFHPLKTLQIKSQSKQTVLTLTDKVKNRRIMYVCGMVAAGLSTTVLSVTDGQPRFLKIISNTKENITITYVLNLKSLKQKP